MNFKNDLQYSSPDSNAQIAIDKVGIVDVKKRIDINWAPSQHYWFMPKISALIYLPKNQRGIHMSRSAEMIEEAINLTVFKPVRSTEQFAKRILDSLLEMHEYTNYAEVKMSGDMILQVSENDERHGQKPFELLMEACANRNPDGIVQYSGFIGISAWGMTCCPCAREMNVEYVKKMVEKRKDIIISNDQLDKLLTVIPIASHNQRAKGTIQIGFSEMNQEIINVIDLIEVIEHSMSSPIQAVLKRPQEAEMVRRAHLNPVFAEDSIRRMAKQLSAEKFQLIPCENVVKMSILSYESIHLHNVYAEIESTMGELRLNFK
jgi:GTP cyclohydrolase IV